MEALGATASILAVVIAALRSAKIIHELLDGIKNGPTHIGELNSKIETLSGLLGQLERVGQRLSGKDIDELKKSTSRCADDLLTFRNKLSKLQNTPGEKSWDRVKKVVKSTLKEEDFLSMGRRLSDYVGVFTVQLGAIGT
jgi:hypothetical protein